MIKKKFPLLLQLLEDNDFNLYLPQEVHLISYLEKGIKTNLINKVAEGSPLM